MHKWDSTSLISFLLKWMEKSFMSSSHRFILESELVHSQNEDTGSLYHLYCYNYGIWYIVCCPIHIRGNVPFSAFLCLMHKFLVGNFCFIASLVLTPIYLGPLLLSFSAFAFSCNLTHHGAGRWKFCLLEKKHCLQQQPSCLLNHRRRKAIAGWFHFDLRWTSQPYL